MSYTDLAEPKSGCLMLFILTISFKPGLTEPAIQLKTSTWLAVEFTKKKHTCMTLMIFKLEPALWSCDIGQQIPCFDRCQKTITSMAAISKILFSCQKRPWVAPQSFTLAYMEPWMDVQSYGDQNQIFLHRWLS